MKTRVFLPLVVLLSTTPVHLASATGMAGEVQGLSQERLARIAPVMKDEIAKGTMPGACDVDRPERTDRSF
jgi:hypothetical protein